MKSGVYKISNVITKDFYLGSSIDINRRKIEHFTELRTRIHCNKHLQNSFNKHGEENFTFEILEECEREILIEREQYYIDTLKPTYNTCLVAGNTLGVKHSEQTKNKISISHKGLKKGKKLTEEHKRKISVSSSKRKHTEETKNKIRNKSLQFKHTPESKLKMSRLAIERNSNPNYIHPSTGIERTDEVKKKISDSKKSKLKKE